MTLRTDLAISRVPLLKGALWTIGAFSIGQLIRLVTSIILARLLAPELFGVMQIVYSLRTGFELISDIGIGQNIIYHSNAEEPDFYNTAWSLQIVRGVLLWGLCCAAAMPFALFYQSRILALLLPVAGLFFIFGGLSSTARFLLQKRMKYYLLVTFDLFVALTASAAQVVFAYLNPTIWALVIGALAGPAANMIGSHFLLPQVRHRFLLSKHHAVQILSFGKWIFVSSIVYFLSTNFDRLFFAKTIPLQLLGVYGIARTISELLSLLILRLGNSVIFPFVASYSQLPRDSLRGQLMPIRRNFLLLAGFAFSVFAGTSDVAIGILYDQRYHAAAWMLPVLIVGAWFAILTNINESVLLGVGQPSYSAAANGAKFGFLLIGLTLAVPRHGILGGVVVVALSELARYVPIFVGQLLNRLSFGKQDTLATLTVIVLIGFWEGLRVMLGFGTSFADLPISVIGDVGIF